MRLTALALAALIPTATLAASLDDDTPPQPTSTTTQCEQGLVWDADSKSCVAPKDSRLDDDIRYGAVREYAYAGFYDAASDVLDAMTDQSSDRVLTYRGFLARKSGDFSTAESYYNAAIAQNPDNFLARSYLGQGLAEGGKVAAARVQLSEIRARGGRGTWPELALRLAIESGRGFSY